MAVESPPPLFPAGTSLAVAADSVQAPCRFSVPSTMRTVVAPATAMAMTSPAAFVATARLRTPSPEILGGRSLCPAANAHRATVWQVEPVTLSAKAAAAAAGLPHGCRPESPHPVARAVAAGPYRVAAAPLPLRSATAPVTVAAAGGSGPAVSCAGCPWREAAGVTPAASSGAPLSPRLLSPRAACRAACPAVVAAAATAASAAAAASGCREVTRVASPASPMKAAAVAVAAAAPEDSRQSGPMAAALAQQVPASCGRRHSSAGAVGIAQAPLEVQGCDRRLLRLTEGCGPQQAQPQRVRRGSASLGAEAAAALGPAQARRGAGTDWDTSVSLASTTTVHSRTPLSPSEAGEVSLSPIRGAAPLAAMERAWHRSTGDMAPAAAAAARPLRESEPPEDSFAHRLAERAAALAASGNLDQPADPYEGLLLTPLNDRPFQAIASIARQAHSSLVERIIPRSPTSAAGTLPTGGGGSAETSALRAQDEKPFSITPVQDMWASFATLWRAPAGW
eukprot:CAMPEP_0180502188 /NCGR_PEP_ID=MMETSP1036_2-20121128/45283_1 /TAXON_ID=632150 /ORGANISM="Azadinium spinosum, Strain 3D9" /LENGTH=508 /DNA_ID=CAMNT_0022510967 /DNA_START=105 /DNA_END=1632 /DNA_ORIENTATION=-